MRVDTKKKQIVLGWGCLILLPALLGIVIGSACGLGKLFFNLFGG